MQNLQNSSSAAVTVASDQPVPTLSVFNQPLRSSQQNIPFQLNGNATLVKTNSPAPIVSGMVRIAPRFVRPVTTLPQGVLVPSGNIPLVSVTQPLILPRPMVIGSDVRPANAITMQFSNPISTPHVPTSNASDAGSVGTGQYLSQAQSAIMENVKKCRNFLHTLIKLASSQPPEIVHNVTSLIQELINGHIEAEAFTTRLQVELNSSPQPYLVPFLKKNLPFLRQLMIQNQLQIDGVKPPPAQAQPVVLFPASGTATTSQATVLPPVASQTAASISQPQTFTHIAAQLQAPGLRPASRIIAPQTIIYQQSVGGTLPSPRIILNRPVTNLTAVIRPLLNETPLSIKDEDSKDATPNRLAVADVVAKKEVFDSPGRNTPIKSDGRASQLLSDRMRQIAERNGVFDLSASVINLVRCAVEEKLTDLAGKLAIVATHRTENMKMDAQHDVVYEPRLQLKFLEELDRCEKKRHEDAERVVLLQAVKSRSKNEDPEQVKLREKAKALQQAEMEELRQREANLTALAAIGPRKKRKLGETEEAPGQTTNTPTSGTVTSTSLRQRTKRVCMKDLLCVFELEHNLTKSSLLYKHFTK